MSLGPQRDWRLPVGRGQPGLVHPNVGQVFVAHGPVSGFPDEIDQVTLAAQTDANGPRVVNSSCSNQSQQPLKLAAKSQGGDLGVEFLTGLVAWGGPESQALTAGVRS